MLANQRKTEIISHNIANINTIGFRSSRPVFSDLVYRKAAGVSEAQLGTGTRIGSIWRDTSQGALQETGRPYDLAIVGRGFFRLQTPEGESVYTRAGAFTKDADGRLTDAQGNLLLDDDDDPIEIPEDAEEVFVAPDGLVSAYVRTRDGEIELDEIAQIGLAQFENEQGLVAIGDGLFMASDASGREDVDNDPAYIRQGVLEMANVDLSQQMVDLMIAQQAYALNARAVQTADQMMALANQLRG